MWNIISLDGFFEGKTSWDLPFHLTVWGKELEQLSIEQLQDTDYLVFGRITYEGMAAHWTREEGEIATLMNCLPKIVCSRSLASAEWNNSILLKDDIVNEIKKLKEEDGKNMYVFGSANLSETLIQEDLFDEYRIGIAPVILGAGRPLFSQATEPVGLTLISTQQTATGAVVLKYVR